MSRRIDDSILEHIAGRDPVGGAERFAEILDELRKIRDCPIIPRPIGGDAREVLQFTCYSEPDAADRTDHRRWELPGLRGHWARAFSCTMLIRAYVDEYARGIDSGLYIPDLIQLLESLRAVDAGFDSDAMAFLAWLIVRLDGDEGERVFAGVGLLSIGARAPDTVPDAGVVALSQWLMAQEHRLFEESRALPDHRSAHERREFADHWLFRCCTHAMLPAKWIALGAELAAFDGAGPRGDAVRAIGRRLSG